MTTFKNINLNIIKILIIGDRNFIQPALHVCLEAETDFNIVGHADNDVTALAVIKQRVPNVVIIDLEMSHASGLNLIRTISNRFRQIKILVLTNKYDRQHIMQSIQMGARGFLVKGTPPRELANAIRSLNWGYFQLGPGLLEKLVVNKHNTNFVEYIPSCIDNKFSYSIDEFKSEIINRSQQLINTKIAENNHRLNDKLELKLHGLKIKQADNSLYIKKLENKIHLLLKIQIGFLIFCLGYLIYTQI